MDAVCIKGDWDVVIAFDPDGNPEGILIYHIRKYRGFNLIIMPPLTFYNGVYLFYKPGIKYHSKVSFENKVYTKLFDLLPQCDLYYQQHGPQLNNWFSLYQKGFKQSTRYSYIIDTSLSEEVLWNNLKGNVRRNIKKAQGLCSIESVGFKLFWDALDSAFKSRKENNPFNKAVLDRICLAYQNTENLSLQICRLSDTGEALAGNLIVHDKDKSYYVCGFYSNNSKELGALSYLLWNNILKTPGSKFDFEGSMIKDIEYFFRAFGGTLTPHYRIWKVHSPLLRFINKFKKIPFID